jgi:malonate decarboxylase beta subunit
VDDDIGQIRDCVGELIALGIPAVHRSEQIARFIDVLESVDASVQATPVMARDIYANGDALC